MDETRYGDIDARVDTAEEKTRAILMEEIASLLETITPIIRAQALREAAAVLEQQAADEDARARDLTRVDGFIRGHIESTAKVVRRCAAAILTLAEQATQTNKDVTK